MLHLGATKAISGLVFALCALGTFACGPTQVARTVEHRDQATHPGWENLSEAETLDRVLTLPGQVGFLRGVVGAPSTRSITDRITGRPTTVTDYPLTTDLFVGLSERSVHRSEWGAHLSFEFRAGP
jgi:hypothetical protein